MSTNDTTPGGATTMEKVIDLDRQKRNGFNPWKLWSRFTITGQDGRPYLVRLTIIGTPWFALMHHTFLRSDADRCCHDHPWPFVTLILSGGYWEETETGGGSRIAWRKRWSLLYRKATHRHRVILATEEGYPSAPSDAFPDAPALDPVPAKTLVLRGPKTRSWGFWTRDGWRHWTDFIERKNAGEDQC